MDAAQAIAYRGKFETPPGELDCRRKLLAGALTSSGSVATRTIDPGKPRTYARDARLIATGDSGTATRYLPVGAPVTDVTALRPDQPSADSQTVENTRLRAVDDVGQDVRELDVHCGSHRALSRVWK
jgi:hypothetical protein